MLESFSRSVTKDLYGPIPFQDSHVPVSLQRFQDAYSIFQWGKMPDALQNRAKANSLVFAYLNQLVQSPAAWKDFLRSADALSFRKASSSITQAAAISNPALHISSMLNEVVETLPPRTNFIGLVTEDVFKKLQTKETLTSAHLFQGPLNPEILNPQMNLFPVCEFYQEEKIPTATVMGRTVWDYSFWKRQTGAKTVPFEVHCHFTLTEESLWSLNTESLSLPKTASLAALQAGSTWDFPLMELVLTQHSFQKKISASEALWITEWKAEKLQELYLHAAWIAAFVRVHLQKKQMKLDSIPLRFGMDADQKFVLIDSLALEDFFPTPELNEFYKKTTWSESVLRAQKQAESGGYNEWKRFSAEPAPWLDPKVKEHVEKTFYNAACTIVGTSCS